MPVLRKFAITNLRNISAAEVNPSPGFNLFFGINGSGKTSILEAIHLLAMGNTFRGHSQKPVIKEGEMTAIVYGETGDEQKLGIQRAMRGPQVIRINGKKMDSVVALVRLLPLQLINSGTFKILEGAPKDRRQFLDWGVFHVEQPFFNYWRDAKIALLNRNNLLKADAASSEIKPWSNELVKNAEKIDSLRSQYINYLAVEFKKLIVALLGEEFAQQFEFRYARGWSADCDLSVQLEKDLIKDRRNGFTTSGPHKADLQFQFGDFSASDVLSRGQLKLLVCALKIAQSRLLSRIANKHCVFLIDDLPAELDDINRIKVCSLLAELKDQIFMTAIDERDLAPHIASASVNTDAQHVCKMFHVEHGIIKYNNPLPRR